MAKKKSANSARYAVNMSMKAWDIAKAGAGLTLKVDDRDGLLATIEIGQGSFRWKHARGKSGFKRLTWEQLIKKLSAK